MTKSRITPDEPDSEPAPTPGAKTGRRTLECAVDGCDDGVALFIIAASLGDMSGSQLTPFCPEHSNELGKFMTALLHESE